MSTRKRTSLPKTLRKRAAKQITKLARPRGRPPLPPELRGARYNVYLLPNVYQAAMKIGNGSLSEGITTAVVRMAAEEMAREAGQRRG